MSATPPPAWDETAVVEAIAASYADWLYEGEHPLKSLDRDLQALWHDVAARTLAALRPHLAALRDAAWRDGAEAAAAKVCGDRAAQADRDNDDYSYAVANECAAAIRALPTPPRPQESLS